MELGLRLGITDRRGTLQSHNQLLEKNGEFRGPMP